MKKKPAMTINRRSALIVAAFIAGVLVLLFTQFRSEKNFSQLVQANSRLVKEYEIGSELRTLESDVLLNENKLRAAVNTGDTTIVDELNYQIADIQDKIDRLQRINDNDSTEIYVDKLDHLIQEKLAFNHQVLDALERNGKGAAGLLVATQKGKRFTDSIQKITHNIRHNRRIILTGIIGTVDKAVAKAERSSSRLILFVLLAASVLFWYIVNTIRTQNKLLQSVRLSEKQAQQSAQIKESFLANMSHEIRTPMNSILGFTDLLAQKNLDPESKLYVQTIRQSGESLLAIVNDILDISKLEAGMVRIESTRFSLRGLIHSVAVMYQSKAAEKGLPLYINVDDALPDTLEGDPVRLTQILLNLVNNAVKFTEAGNICIQVKKQGWEGQKLKVGIRVEDTGIGIGKEKLAAIFDRFQQADDSITRKYGGTGLGLSIVKNLVDLQGGSIAVESQPGRGTVFQLIIPYKISGLQPVPALPGEMSATPALPLSDLHLLVVEDNEVNQSLLQHLFRNWNIRCALANNGAEALELLKAKTFDLILMDIQMPEMDGYTAAQKIRTELRLNTPIIAMTAHAMAGEREKCLRSGMNEYLAKPIRQEDLANLLARLIPESKVPATAKPPAIQQEKEAYSVINLAYMKSISAGNKAYEVDVTKKFLAAAPLQLRALEEAGSKQNADVIKQLAHKMKSTISVMGLNEKLEAYLDTLESANSKGQEEAEALGKVREICSAALIEAKQFLLSVSPPSAIAGDPAQIVNP